MPLDSSRAYEVHVAPPVGGLSGVAFVQVARAGPESGTVSKRQITCPSSADNAKMRPVTPKLSPPALPTNSIPFHAMGAKGTDSPREPSPIATSQICAPFEALIA